MRELQKIQLAMEPINTNILRSYEVSEKERRELIFPIENEKLGFVSAINFQDVEWEHVMLDTWMCERCPNYKEMTRLKDVFWKEDEIAFQVYPKQSEYVNKREYCLHLWRNREISERRERILKQKINEKIQEAKSFYEKGKKQEILLDGDNKILALFGGDRWLRWNEISEIKRKYWKPEEVAVQFNISQKYDLNKEHIILLWDAEDFLLPPRELV